MKYRKFGNTGFEISAVGFGAMRLPEYEKDGKWYMREEESIAAMHRAFDLGVNYIDTAWMYSHGNSQAIVGKGLKGYHGKVKVSTKLPMGDLKKPDDFWYFLEQQLKQLEVDCIDFYHLHGLNNNSFEEKALAWNLIDKMEDAKRQGMIAHKSFSFHDNPEVMRKIIDTDAFESVLCQYNLLDRRNEEVMKYAHDKGLGVVCMGPVAGGRLAVTSDVLKNMIGNVSGTTEIALRFVLANNDVSCALSGMENIKMVEENTEIASREDEMSAAEWLQVSDALEEVKAMSDLYCSGCNYCQPCPKDIDIARVFHMYNLHKIYGLTDFVKKEYNEMKVRPADCISCGKCVKKCPQFIKIPDKLREAESALGVV